MDKSTPCDVVCFGIVDWDYRWQRPQQIMSGLAERGHRVFHVSPGHFGSPLGPEFAVVPLAPNVDEVRLRCQSPPLFNRGEPDARTAAELWEGIEGLRSQQRIERAVALIQTPNWRPIALAARDSFGWPLVYDCMDDWEFFPDMNPVGEVNLVQEADLVITSARFTERKWRQENSRTLLVRNGCEYRHFRSGRRDIVEVLESPIIGFFGAIADWFDIDLVSKAAALYPHCTFVLLGDIDEDHARRLASVANVIAPGRRPYALLPHYLAGFDVCLIPFKDDQLSSHTDPVKFYEYLCQGKPVVATPLPELQDQKALFYATSGANEFCDAIQTALTEADPFLRRSRIDFARANTWELRLDDIQCAFDSVLNEPEITSNAVAI